MGLLDDAIREHLELKKLHGDDPQEIARLEKEALGPVRREDILSEPDSALFDGDAGFTEPTLEAPVEVDSFPTETMATVAVDEPGVYSESEHLPAEPAIMPDTSHAAIPDPMAVAESQRQIFEQPAELPDAPVPVSEPVLLTGDDPVPHDAFITAAVAESPLAPPQQDFLQETPDFLEDTPEHDRLWFEQKPPKDFDFEG